MHFEFVTATRIIFGSGTIKRLGTLAQPLGKQALVVTGADSTRAQTALMTLDQAGIKTHTFAVKKEPDIQTINHGAGLGKENNCDLVIGIGGGSALDSGKAIAALLNNPGELYDYLEVVGHGRKLKNPSLPYIAIPTTAGTGAEVTANAVLTAGEEKVKVSLRSPFMLPAIALVDPSLTCTMSMETTINTGLDALTQVMEPFVSHLASPITDVFCKDALCRVSRSLRTVITSPDNLPARENMALVSLYGGLALANAKLGAVHGLAGPFGGMFAAPHGAVCAVLLPHVMNTNIRALQDRHSDSKSLERYLQVAELLTKSSRANIFDGPKWILKLCSSLNIKPLRSYGFNQSHIPELCHKAMHSSSMKGNPIELEQGELEQILLDAL